MFRVLGLTWIILAGATGSASAAISGERLGWVENRLPEIREKVAIQTGVPVAKSEAEAVGNDVLVKMESLEGAHRSKVLLSDLSEENLDTRVEEAGSLIAHEFAAASRFREPVHSGSRDFEMIEVGPRVGGEVGAGSFPYASVWVQLPSIGGEKHGAGVRSRWMRTRVLLEGALIPDDNREGDRKIVATRLTSHVFELDFAHHDTNSGWRGVTLVQLGTVDARARLGGHGVDYDLGFDPVRLVHGGSVPIATNLTFYYTMSMGLGVRTIESNLSELRAAIGASFRVGMLIGNHLFVEAGSTFEAVYGGTVRTLFMGRIGWRFNENVSIAIGGGYNSGGASPYAIGFPGGGFILLSLTIHF